MFCDMEEFTYVTEETFRLTEGLFRFEAMGEREIKGRKERVKVDRPIAPSTRRTRFDISTARGLTEFVGRERELESGIYQIGRMIKRNKKNLNFEGILYFLRLCWVLSWRRGWDSNPRSRF